MLLMSCCHVVSCRSSGSRVRNCKLFNEGTCPRQSSMQQKAWLMVRFLPGPPNSPEPRRVQPTKKWPRKKKTSWPRQRQQITEAADGGARARTGADGAVALNLRRGPGAYALLSRADGQLTRAGQHYYSHLGLRPPSKDFDYNQPLIREGPNDYILLRNGRKKLVRSLQGGEHRLTKLGKGFFRHKYYKYLVHVPVIIRGRRRSGRNAGAGYGERAGRRHDEARRSRWRSGSGSRLRPRWATLPPRSCSSQTRPTSLTLGHWVVSTQSTQYRNSRTEVETLLRQRMRGLRSVSFQLPCEEDVLQSAFEDKPLCVPRQLAEVVQVSVEEVCADFDAMLRHDWRRLGISAEGVRAPQGLRACGGPARVADGQAVGTSCWSPWRRRAARSRPPAARSSWPARRPRTGGAARGGRTPGPGGRGCGEARQTLPPIGEWRRFDAADVQRACSGARTCARRGASLWSLARAPRWPSAARRSTAG